MYNENIIETFWNDFLNFSGEDKNCSYLEYFRFELEEKISNRLLELVLSGKKQATSSSYKAYEIRNEKLPKKGDYSIVTNWNYEPKCVIKTTNVTILPFCNITFDICKHEGEDENLTTWQIGHRNFFIKDGKELGYEFSEDMLVVFENFEMVFKK